MVLLQGKGVSKGVVKGPLYFFKRQDNTVTKCIVEDIEAEKVRFAAAQEAAIEQLTALADRCREEAGDESAILFETHAMFVEDEDMVEAFVGKGERFPAESIYGDFRCNGGYLVFTEF